MPFQRTSSVLASALLAGLILAVASCTGTLAPLGPDARPQPSHLRSPIVLQAMSVQLPPPSGRCLTGYARLSAPGMNPGPCYRKLGPPVTITSAAVSSYRPATPSGRGGTSGASGLLFTVPSSDVAALTAVTSRAYDSRGAVDISVDGRTWALPMALAPLTHGQFAIVLPTSNQAAQLQRTLTRRAGP
jgi:hypothetical protein